MRVGIVGCGMVGGAVAYGLNQIGHDIYRFDRAKFPHSTMQDILATEVCFICVPTPPLVDGSCDTTIVEGVVAELYHCEYKGVVVIKSTVTPGTTDRLLRIFQSLRLVFCPEFLRERVSLTDFVENHEVCIIGTHNHLDALIVTRAHGELPEHVVQMKPIEAELTKYFCNVLNAMRIVYANEFFDVCEKVGADYQVIKLAVGHRKSVGAYLDCAEGLRGYGGSCLPKDTSAFAAYVQGLGLDTQLYDAIIEINERHI